MCTAERSKGTDKEPNGAGLSALEMSSSQAHVVERGCTAAVNATCCCCEHGCTADINAAGCC